MNLRINILIFCKAKAIAVEQRWAWIFPAWFVSFDLVAIKE